MLPPGSARSWDEHGSPAYQTMTAAGALPHPGMLPPGSARSRSSWDDHSSPAYQTMTAGSLPQPGLLPPASLQLDQLSTGQLSSSMPTAVSTPDGNYSFGFMAPTGGHMTLATIQEALAIEVQLRVKAEARARHAEERLEQVSELAMKAEAEKKVAEAANEAAQDTIAALRQELETVKKSLKPLRATIEIPPISPPSNQSERSIISEHLGLNVESPVAPESDRLNVGDDLWPTPPQSSVLRVNPLVIHLSGRKFPRSERTFIIVCCQEKAGKWIQISRSNVSSKTKNPDWDPIVINDPVFCTQEPTKRFMLSCWSHDDATAMDVLRSTVATSLERLAKLAATRSLFKLFPTPDADGTSAADSGCLVCCLPWRHLSLHLVSPTSSLGSPPPSSHPSSATPFSPHFHLTSHLPCLFPLTCPSHLTFTSSHPSPPPPPPHLAITPRSLCTQPPRPERATYEQPSTSFSCIILIYVMKSC
mmetsp:Transcript_64264/g.152052  ORF Transcript_64264/g.152052 Transcript_64264/m.152052 type:complete len:476 (-) Transcript_64264:13-1440(-)